MSLPNVVLPWSSQNAPSLSGGPTSGSAPVSVPEPEPEPGHGPIAAALYRAGFTASAAVLVEASSDPSVHALVEQWRETAAADAALADLIARQGGALIPSVATRRDGSPRFVVRFSSAAAAVAAIDAEHGDRGVDPELRLFLDEALRDGDRFVDADPGDGFGALSAASGSASVSVIVLCDAPEHCALISDSAQASGVEGRVIARVASTLDQVPTVPTTPGASTLVHAGSAASVAVLLRGVRGALERREIGAVAWRCGLSGANGPDAESMQVAAAVLGMFGFIHFALASGEAGTELVPAEAMATNAMIFSLEPSFLARFAG